MARGVIPPPVAFLDTDAVYFELERFKAGRGR